MGTVEVPADAYYGASTRRAELNFPISDLRFPRSFIRALGLVKQAADGAYQRVGESIASRASTDAAVRRAVVDYMRSVDQVQQLLVLRTDAGLAQPLALAIDRARIREVVGTVAGDDTILVITRHARAGREVTRLFEGWARG